MPRVIQVIESDEARGSGADHDNRCRRVTMYHSLDGEPLAERDIHPTFDELFGRCCQLLDQGQKRRFAARLLEVSEVGK